MLAEVNISVRQKLKIKRKRYRIAKETHMSH